MGFWILSLEKGALGRRHERGASQNWQKFFLYNRIVKFSERTSNWYWMKSCK
jgi:hypothetical protein